MIRVNIRVSTGQNCGVIILATEDRVHVLWFVTGIDCVGRYNRDQFERLVRENRLTLSEPEEEKTT